MPSEQATLLDAGAVRSLWPTGKPESGPRRRSSEPHGDGKWQAQGTEFKFLQSTGPITCVPIAVAFAKTLVDLQRSVAGGIIAELPAGGHGSEKTTAAYNAAVKLVV